MYCPKCGAQNPDTALVCSSCSAVLTPPTEQVPTTPAKTSGMAIAALVLAILSPFTCFISAIFSIIFGIVALVKISQSKGQLKGIGLAVTGIALPVVILPFIPCLMGILFPALARTRQLALRTHCAVNMSTIGKAMLIYANDFDDKFPISPKWCDLLIEHAEVTPATFRCKGAHEGPCNYAINKNIENFDTGNAPHDMVILFETHPGWNQVGGPELLTTENHQSQGCNVLFADNHVEFVTTKDLDKLKW
jgi:prepilin-type processing-associated H-X9-DG protein